MLTVSKLAKKAGVTSHSIRHYSELGLLSPTRNPDNGYQMYELAEVKRVRFIRLAQSLGFSLQELQEIFAAVAKGDSPCPRVREILAGRIEENKQRLLELTALQARMESALAHWDNLPDGVPDGDSVCCLIENLEERE